jgi:hypothetical protein
MAGDPSYLQYLRNRPCACQPCAAATEAHHSTVAPTHAPGARPEGKQLGGKRGRGQRSHDAWAFPLCARHHGQLHRLTGYFAGWSGEELERWQNEQSAAYRAEYDAGVSPAAEPAVKSAGLAPVPGSQDIVDLEVAGDRFLESYPAIGHSGRLDFVRVLKSVVKATREGRVST